LKCGVTCAIIFSNCGGSQGEGASGTLP